MRVFKFSLVLLIVAAGAGLVRTEITRGQAATKPPAASAQASAKIQPDGNLLQVMRAILFTNSNVIFFAQSHDPAAIKRQADPTNATDPFAGSYGGWEAVENSSIALAEAANLLTVPGRMCSNGKPVPVQNADWIKFVQGLREAGMAAYKAAKTKSQDNIVDVSDTVTTACSNCHDVYREKTAAQGGMAARCTK